MDDTSKVSDRIRGNFEGMVYDLCSGKGKSRSNRDLGVNRENRWQNRILTSGERALQTYVSQGGAINRILKLSAETISIRTHVRPLRRSRAIMALLVKNLSRS